MTGPDAIAPPLQRFLRVVAIALAIYLVSWASWALIVYLGFRPFLEWARIPADDDWSRDPTFFQRLLALPPLLPVLIWIGVVIVKDIGREHRS